MCRVTRRKRYIRKDGRIVWVRLFGSIVMDDEDRPKTTMAVVVDITERRLADEQLRAADRRKDEFLAMLAHELRNPVAPILSVAEALARMSGRDERQHVLVGIVQRQASHLSRLLDGLLDVARITQGRIELQREVVPLADCIAVACESSDPLIRAKQQTLHVVHEQSLPVFVDRVRIAQCIGNLLSNAAKYSDSAAEIFVRSWRDGNFAVLTVRDDGAGIAPDFLPHVFDLFAQGERSLDRSQGGLGIGLSVSRKLVQLHDGQIEAASDGPGLGATFTIRLPLAEDTAERRQRSRAPPSCRSACSSSTTIMMRPTPWRCCCGWMGTRSRLRTARRMASARSMYLRRPSCCSISACQRWTGTRPRADLSRAASRSPDRHQRLRRSKGQAACSRCRLLCASLQAGGLRHARKDDGVMGSGPIERHGGV